MMKPLRSVAGINTPMTVPHIEPRPPNRLVPPITTAEIAASTSWVCASMDATPKREMSVTAARPARPPISTYSEIWWEFTWMPERRAASELEPIALVWRPKRVAERTKPSTTTTTTAVTTGHGTTPPSRPSP